MPAPVVVMGVSGCGKTSVAQALAAQLGWRALDADELHSPQAVAKMHAGQALTDDDRWPWLQRVGAALAQAATQHQGLALACSALRLRYREQLRAACPTVRFVFLDGPRELLAERMAGRSGHYMPAHLLDSQLQTLERPSPQEPGVVCITFDQPLAQLVQQAIQALAQGPACDGLQGLAGSHTHPAPAALAPGAKPLP